MRLLYTVILILTSQFLFSQTDFNFELLSNPQFPEAGNDIWGFVSEGGTEFAIVGTVDNTRIYNLADPTAPVEVIAIPGSNIIWRDMKSWEDHVYVTSESNDGLLVVDMSQADNDSIRWQLITPEVITDAPAPLGACHNIYIDENGFAYLAGCGNQTMDKAIILDLNQDKWNPPVIAAHGDGYAHDLFVRDNIMYSSEIFSGQLRIFDVTDKSNLVLLGETNTTFNFTHNTWISDDGNYAYTTDERGDAYVDAYDISDFTNIRLLDVFQPLETAGQGVVPHNTHFQDEYLITSWYTDGVVITDVSRPTNMVKVGAFDTFFGGNGGTNGCWGAYPYLPSGIVLATDRNNGLFVLQPNYQRACWLEGNVTVAGEGSPINNVDVNIQSTELNGGTTNITGNYGTGVATAGSFAVTFFHPEFEPLETTATLVNGEVTILDVELVRKPVFQVNGRFVDAATGENIPTGVFEAESLSGPALNISSDGNGNFVVDVFDETYEAVAGAWGFRQRQLSFSPDNNEIVIELVRGWEDDFVLDFGWRSEGTATAGLWERGVPIGTGFRGQIANINVDIDGDIGEEAYVTGNGGGNAGFDDVDDGTAILTSPPMNLSDFINPEIQFNAYFFNDGGAGEPTLDDMVDFSITDGDSLYLFSTISSSTGTWTDVIRIRPLDLGIDITNDIQLQIATGDNADNGNLVESAIDVFRVEEGQSTSTLDITNLSVVKVFPNPTTDYINIVSNTDDLQNIRMYDIKGRKVMDRPYETLINVQDLQSGQYIIEFEKISGERLVSRVIIK